MGRLFIILIAVAGMIWNVDPFLRPFIDVLMGLLVAGLMFTLGDRFENWLCRWEAKPHWRKVRRPKGQHYHQSGATMPLLER